MRIDEFDLIGKPSPRLSDIMQKHGISYKEAIDQLSRGIKIELEHTGDIAVAREIALDHLDEFPDYYDRLEKAEKK